MTDDQAVEVNVETQVVAEKPKVSKKKGKEVQLSLDQYFNQCDQSVGKYTRAYVAVSYHGIIKTMTEWSKELKGKL